MKVKIGKTVYDSEKEPILLILTEKDKKNIGNMSPEASKYCIFPDCIPIDKIKKFMKID